MQILKAEKVNKFFHLPDEFQVLNDISFSMDRGEFVSIMGKSGCGKSTLLYLLSTMDTDYTGEIWLDGQKISGLPANDLARIRNEKIGSQFTCIQCIAGLPHLIFQFNFFAVNAFL